MFSLRNIVRGLEALFRRERVEREMEEELRAYVEMAIEEKVQQGMSREEAARAVRLERGSMDGAKEMVRDAGWESFVEILTRDLRFALRLWRKNPVFGITAAGVLALGMGVSVSIFGFVDAALLQPLPYERPERLMSVNESNAESPRWPLSYPDYLNWQRLNKSFSSLDVYAGAGYLLRAASGAVPVQGERVSGGFFTTLGVRPILGRDFAPNENRVGGPNVVILTYGAWVQYFGTRKEVIGQTVDLDDQAFTVIGVLPRTFSFARAGNAEFFVPINTLSHHEQMKTFYNFWGIGRLRDGVTISQARAEMNGIAKQLQTVDPTSDRYEGASVLPLLEVIVGEVRPILLMLLGGAGLLLLIACVNVTSLVLVHSENRKREIAVRGVLGASRAQLLRQLATEALLLAGLGSLAAMVFAHWLMKGLSHTVPKDMAASLPFLAGVEMNAHTAAFTAGVALGAAIFLATVTTFWLSRQKVRGVLSDGDSRSGSRFWKRLGARMVIVELGIAVVLLAGAGLLGQSLYRLLHVRLGFEPIHLATVDITIPQTAFKNNEQMVALYREILGRVSSLPGVESAGISSMVPVQCNCPVDWITFPGRTFHGEHNTVDERHVSADYLPTLKAALIRGRLFTDSEDTSKPQVIVINQTLARKYFPGEDPIGQKIGDYEGGVKSEHEIVGIVDDVREGPLDADIWPTEYLPINQTLDHGFSLVVRTRQDAPAILLVLVNTLHQLSPDLGVSNELTMSERIGSTQAALLHRFSAWLVGGFAIMALVLSTVGLYGMIAYSVSQRTREIGVRMALGADQKIVVLMILRQAGKIVALGVVVGVIGSLALTRLSASLLFGVTPYDPVTLAAVVAMLSSIALIACYIPARRASHVDPMIALRYE